MPRVFHNEAVLDDLFIDPDEGEPARIPYNVQEIFYEMTLMYLLDQPSDPLQFCYDYLGKLKNQKKVEIVIEDPEPEEVLGDDYNRRRLTIWSSGVNLEDRVPVGMYYDKSKGTRSDLKKMIKEIILFKCLDKEDINRIIDAMRQVIVPKGDTVITENDEGDACYLIESGIFTASRKVSDETKLIKTYENRGFFGELALMYNAPRAATVVAQSDGVLWALDRAVFKSVAINRDLHRRRTFEELVKSVPMFSFLTVTEKEKLIDSLDIKTFKSGECIMKEDDTADGMYFVMSGKVIIRKRDTETMEEIELATLASGDFFGEVALVFDKPRSASAYADSKAVLAFISVERFERLLGPCIEILKRQFDTYESMLKELFGKTYTIKK